MKVIYCLLCEKIILEEVTQVPSFISIVEELRIEPPDDFSMPDGETVFIPGNLAFSLLTESTSDWDIGEPDVDVSLLTQSGAKHRFSKVPVKFERVGQRNRVNIILRSIAYDGPGDYSVVAETLGDGEICRFPVRFTLVQ